MVDVLCLCLNVVNLRNLGVLGHLVDLADQRDVRRIADELRQRSFPRLLHNRRLRDLSLYRNKHGNNLVGVLCLQNLVVLGHLCERW